MEVHGTRGSRGVTRVDGRTTQVPAKAALSAATPARDRVEISNHSRLLEALSRVPEIRAERVDELRRIIESGDFETPERIEGAVVKILEEFGYVPR
jgi:negative regulator of flagellin synthesis FlgM